jgi:hypothetical protein
MRKTLFGLLGAMAACAPGALAHSAPLSGANACSALAPAALVIELPEPSSMALLAIDLFAVGALIFVLRRRASKTNR